MNFINKLLQTDTNNKSLAVLSLILFPLLLVLFFTLIDPRPYYLLFNLLDIEADYYYNAKLFWEGYAINGYHHPGGVIYLLLSIIASVFGTDLPSTQTVFNVSYFVIGLFATFSLVLSFRILSRHTSFNTSIFIILIVLSWPPLITFLNYYGADSFVPFLSLLVGLFAWDLLNKKTSLSDKSLIILSVLLGFSFTIKMSFLPLLFASIVAVALYIIFESKNKLSIIKQFFYLGSFSLVGYIIGMMPIVHRIPYNIARFIYLSRSNSGAVSNYHETILSIFHHVPFYMTFIALIYIFLIISIFLVIRQSISSNEKFKWIPSTSFVALLGAGFYFTLLNAYWLWSSVGLNQLFGQDLGIIIRNTSGASVFLPIAILYIYKSPLNTYLSDKFIKVPNLLVVLGLVIAIPSIYHYISTRTDNLKVAKQQEQLLLKSAAEMQKKSSGKVGVWESYGFSNYFHLWGNYKYAASIFNKSLNAEIKDVAFVNLQHLHRYSYSRTTALPEVKKMKKSSVMQAWDSFFPVSYNQLQAEMLYEQHISPEISGIIIPTSEYFAFAASTKANLITGYLDKYLNYKNTKWIATYPSLNTQDYIFISPEYKKNKRPFPENQR